MENQELWQAVLAQIQLNTSQASFITWFKNTKIINEKDGTIYVSVPNNFTKEWLENKYNKTILKILQTFNKEIKNIQYNIIPLDVKNTKLSPQKTKKNLIQNIKEEQLEFNQFKIDKKSGLNPQYTFSTFIVGSFNELAHAAALAICENPGATYNPMFVYGGVGLGKTHLLQAIGQKIKESFPDKNIKYVSSEKFTSDILTSIRTQKIAELKSLYKQFDILIVDDIQFLAGKEKTQEEFFHIFNALYEKGGQIILSSDRSPKTIPQLEERLMSRFEGGMISDISLPDFETRVAILKSKSHLQEVDFSDEIINYIASNIKTNIRELEGALNKLINYLKLKKQTLDIEITKNLLKNLILSPKKITNFKKIIKSIIGFYGLKEKDLFSCSRKKEVVRPRQIAMYFLRKELKYSYSFIAQKFNKKDHTTVIYACEKITKEFYGSDSPSEEANLIYKQFYN